MVCQRETKEILKDLFIVYLSVNTLFLKRRNVEVLSLTGAVKKSRYLLSQSNKKYNHLGRIFWHSQNKSKPLEYLGTSLLNLLYKNICFTTTQASAIDRRLRTIDNPIASAFRHLTGFKLTFPFIYLYIFIENVRNFVRKFDSNLADFFFIYLPYFLFNQTS